MARRTMVYEGREKILYEGPEPGTLVQHYKDVTVGGRDRRREVADGKGVLNNRICEHVMSNLNQIGVPTHFVRRLNMREQLVRHVDVFPLQLQVRNIALGSFAKRLGMEDGELLRHTVLEFYLKDEELGFPLLNEDHISIINCASGYDVDDMRGLAIKMNDFLTGMFLGAGIRLAEVRFEFGRLWIDEDANQGDTQVVVADEISPDTCCLLDIATGARLDSESLQFGVHKMIEAYTEVARRLGVVKTGETQEWTGPRLVRRSEK